MSARRGSAVRRKRDAFKVPAGAPAWCSPLDDMDDAEARDLIEPGKRYTIAPKDVLAAGGAHVLVTCDGEGQPFRVLDADKVVRGVLASWAAAARLMVALAVEHETGRSAEARP